MLQSQRANDTYILIRILTIVLGGRIKGEGGNKRILRYDRHS